MYDAKRTASATSVMWDEAQHGPMSSVPDQILNKGWTVHRQGPDKRAEASCGLSGFYDQRRAVLSSFHSPVDPD